jgi:hypothetical protein
MEFYHDTGDCISIASWGYNHHISFVRRLKMMFTSEKIKSLVNFSTLILLLKKFNIRSGGCYPVAFMRFDRK